jgi:hypothetical protein
MHAIQKNIHYFFSNIALLAAIDDCTEVRTGGRASPFVGEVGDRGEVAPAGSSFFDKAGEARSRTVSLLAGEAGV